MLLQNKGRAPSADSQKTLSFWSPEPKNESSGFDSWASGHIVIDLHRVIIVCGGARVE